MINYWFSSDGVIAFAVYSRKLRDMNLYQVHFVNVVMDMCRSGLSIFLRNQLILEL